MRIETIAEHSVDLDLLPEKANILDIGCRGFIFTDEMRRRGHKVFPIDCDDLGKDKAYYRYAIVGKVDGPVYIQKSDDPQATRITKEITNYGIVFPHTIKSFSDMLGMYGEWDLIKIDVEGAEYEIIMSLDSPPAKQLSIEFHLHTGIYENGAVTEMRLKLFDLGYIAVQHEKTSQHGMGLNYWDSLFILQ